MGAFSNAAFDIGVFDVSAFDIATPTFVSPICAELFYSVITLTEAKSGKVTGEQLLFSDITSSKGFNGKLCE